MSNFSILQISPLQKKAKMIYIKLNLSISRLRLTKEREFVEQFYGNSDFNLTYSWPLNMGLNCTSPLIYSFKSTVLLMYFPYDFLNIFFSLAYFIIIILYVIHIQNMCLSTVYVIVKASSQH